MYLGDFTITAIALAASALKWNNQKHGEAMIDASIGMSIAVGDNLAETWGTCRR
jgi:hypothetical protein